MRQMDRDTQKCAFKCSHLTFKDGKTRVVYKVGCFDTQVDLSAAYEAPMPECRSPRADRIDRPLDGPSPALRYARLKYKLI